MKKYKLAVVHDDFIQYGGAELFVYDILKELKKNQNFEISVFSSIITKDWENKLLSLDLKIQKSFLSYLPYSRKISKLYFLSNLYYVAFESFDFSDFDIVFSSSTRFGHTVITKPDTLHLSYINSPSKMLWEIRKYFFGKKMQYNFIKNFLPKKRIFDYITQQRADLVISNSKNISKKVKKIYQRQSQIIYPFVNLPSIKNINKKEDYYILISRIIPWKRIDYVIEAFNNSSKKLLIIGKGNNDYINYLKSISTPNIKFLGYISNEEKVSKLSLARGLIIPQDEDFGLIIPEALLLGTPIVYFNKGGASEILSNFYGESFESQDSTDLLSAINRLENREFDHGKLIEYGQNFTADNFTKQLIKLIESKV